MAPYLYRWKTRPDAAALERNVDELRTVIIQLRHELGNKQRHVGQLKVLLLQRTEQIDELANTIAALRDQNRRLNEEADHLAAKWSGCREAARGAFDGQISFRSARLSRAMM